MVRKQVATAQNSEQAESEQATLSELTAPIGTDVSDAPAGASGAIRIERLILHHLDNRKGELKLVDDEALLDTRSEIFFTSHILAAARRADWRARFQRADDEVPALCRNLLSATTEMTERGFVGASQQLAHRLFDAMCQRRNITPGDFVAIVYTADDNPLRHLALLKLDPDQERLIRTFERVHGRLRVSITTAGNILPDTIRLQKCALLTRLEDGGDFQITLLDTDGRPSLRSDGIASFFYHDFLTATLSPSARRHTRLFIMQTEGWLDERRNRLSPAAVLRFYRARRKALTGDWVDLASLACEALPDAPELQADLINFIQRTVLGAPNGESAPASFAVDKTIAGPFTQMVTLELDGGLRIRVDARRFDELVQVAEHRTSEDKFRLTLESLTLREATDERRRNP